MNEKNSGLDSTLEQKILTTAKELNEIFTAGGPGFLQPIEIRNVKVKISPLVAASLVATECLQCEEETQAQAIAWLLQKLGKE